MLTNGAQESGATVMADGGAAYDESTNPGQGEATRALVVRTPGEDVPTDPGRTPTPRAATPAGAAAPASGTGWGQPQQQALPARPGPPVLTPSDPSRRATRPMPPPEPSGRQAADTAPTLTPAAQPAFAPRSASQAGLEPQNNTRLIVALAGIVALLVIGLTAAIMLRPARTGLVVIGNVPEDVQGRVELKINGELITEKDGAPITKWPVVRQVKVGKAAVQLSAPGYQQLLELVEVTEAEPVQLTKEMKKLK
jgi:hypothetical protein